MTTVQKIYIGFFLMIFGFSNSVFSQKSYVPGYLGKRSLVEYNFYLSPGLLSTPNKSFAHNINFHYIMKRRFQMGVNYENYHLFSEDNRYDDIDETSLQGKSIGLNFDWYGKRLLAPVGLYFRVGVKYLFGNYNEYKEWETFDFPNFVRHTESDAGSYTHFAYTLEYGIRRVFYDNFVFNVGGSFGDVVGTGVATIGYQSLLSRLYSIRFHVGIGVLLF